LDNVDEVKRIYREAHREGIRQGKSKEEAKEYAIYVVRKLGWVYEGGEWINRKSRKTKGVA
jgi:transcription initiation factor TFIIIB Brf1 subunit/transcription initiation factor TFIIB